MVGEQELNALSKARIDCKSLITGPGRTNTVIFNNL